MTNKADTVIRSFRLPKPLLERLQVEAEQENRSVNNLVIHLLNAATDDAPATQYKASA